MRFIRRDLSGRTQAAVSRALGLLERPLVDPAQGKKPKGHCAAPEIEKAATVSAAEAGPDPSALPLTLSLVPVNLAPPAAEIAKVPHESAVARTQGGWLLEARGDGRAMSDQITVLQPLPDGPDLYAADPSFIPDAQGAGPEPVGGPSMASRVQPDTPGLKAQPEEHVEDPVDRSLPAPGIARPHAPADAAANLNSTVIPPDTETGDKTM